MLEETYGHSPLKKMFDQADVYGVGFDAERAARRPMRLGIIGAGGVSQSKHIPAVMRLRTIWEPVTLAAISSLDERSGRQLQASYGCTWYSDFAKMLDTESLDAVLVAGPSELHAEHAIACVERGIPVMVEKPLCRSIEDARQLCLLAKRRGALMMTVANKRFSPPYRRAKRMVTDGPVREPAAFCGKFNLGYDYVPDMLQDGTIHLLDLARFFMGDVASVSATAINRYARNPAAAHDYFAATLRFTSGAIGQVFSTSSALSLKPWERVEVYANKAWLAVEDQHELIVYDEESGPAKSWKPAVPNTLLFDEEFGGYVGLMENFLQAARGAEPAAVTGWDGYHALALADAIKQSAARDGAAVQLSGKAI